jgi:hypothetical protein
MQTIDDIATGPCVESDWGHYNNAIADQILTGDISHFTEWDVIRQTMFTKLRSLSPLEYLQSLPDWEKWEKAIVESPVGNPEPYELYPQSSGNLIMQAELLARFLSNTDCKIENLNKIYEFGGGYGCMCRLIHNFGFTGEYTIMDLPAVLQLQQYYLGEMTNGRITYLRDEVDFKKQMTRDESLFIATWSISEVSYEMRKRILGGINTKYVLIIFQATHNDFDNYDYFEKFVHENTSYEFDCLEMPYEFPHGIKHYYLFGTRKCVAEYQTFVQMSKEDNRFEIRRSPRCLEEPEQKGDKPYIMHTGWAARILAACPPEKHVDISSLLYFNTLVSAFIPIDSYDYRPLDIPLSGLRTNFADLAQLPFADNSIPSLSCMHVVEHIGLGRYGDPLDPDGDLKAISELKRVLAGDLLFVVPVGKPRVIFNIHRIYSYEQIMSYFEELKLVEFMLIPDVTPGNLIRDAKELVAEQNNGCGCFWFRKD